MDESIKAIFYDFGGLNHKIFWLINNLVVSPWASKALAFISHIASMKFFPIYLMVLCVYFLTVDKKSDIVRLLLQLTIGYLLILLVVGSGKYLFYMPRPVVVFPDDINIFVPVPEKHHYLSFPSGHTSLTWMVLTVFHHNVKLRASLTLRSRIYSMLSVVDPRHKTYITLRAVYIIVILLGIMVPFSRIYLGHHFPADIFYSIFIGMIIGQLAIYISNKYCNH